MKTYNVDNLGSLLLENGFKDVTKKHDLNKGKREFRFTIKKSIFFNYQNIEVFYDSINEYNFIEISEDLLNHLMFFFKASQFNFENSISKKKLESLR